MVCANSKEAWNAYHRAVADLGPDDPRTLKLWAQVKAIESRQRRMYFSQVDVL